MIVHLEDTTSAAVASELVTLREQGGVMALGRVMTLVIVCSGSGIERAVQAANAASREHPSRVLVIAPEAPEAAARLDAEIRVGGDAGASDVVILRPRGAVVAPRRPGRSRCRPAGTHRPAPDQRCRRDGRPHRAVVRSAALLLPR